MCYYKLLQYRQNTFNLKYCCKFILLTEICNSFIKWDFLYDSDRDCHVRDRIVVGFTTTYAISVYHHERCELESCLWRAVLDTALCDKICQWHAAGGWFSPDTPFSSTNKTDSHDRTEILLTVALSTIALVIALMITISFLNVNFLLFQLFSFYFLLNWYFVRMIKE